ncbi:LLM class flavin-dependent oxidoreductase [Myroides sp. NP-2]|uniref:LLM class flavin-dependent oxidoreductase n=1 Tax=Myroides sp. NP-2 TaxID=2759945 RepID=UPI0015FC20EA|nr:LLM class flavin-dependent oxidoreductase [Myroides sp. NP-2]MBB1149791.1 LLM class flavin-dependent oxidoreductase [Myroides sp. NP-2]
MKRIRLGLIDLGYRENVDALTSIEEIIEYVVIAEKLGFYRFWLAEHHYYHFKSHPFTVPDVLIGLLAGMTDDIRIGSAGTAISLHSPYVVVTNYKLLNNLFNGRISLGLSKGVAESMETNYMINRNLNTNNSILFFRENLARISDLIENEEFNLNNFNILIPPYAGLKPELWYLTTSFKNYVDAVQYKTNYCISIFHNFNQDIDNLPFNKEDIINFRSAFFKRHNYYPEIAISLAIILKNTMEEALSEWHEIMDDFSKNDGSQSFIVIPCTPDSLYSRLVNYLNEFEISEFIIYDTAPSNEEKVNNIKKISKVFNLLKETNYE